MAENFSHLEFGGFARSTQLMRDSALLRATTELFIQEESHSPDEVRRYEELTAHLLPKVSEEDRVFLAERLAKRADAPQAVVRMLAKDRINVARAVLGNSPVLGALDLLSIIAATSGEHHRIIAGRRGLTPEVRQALRISADRAFAATLDEIETASSASSAPVPRPMSASPPSADVEPSMASPPPPPTVVSEPPVVAAPENAQSAEPPPAPAAADGGLSAILDEIEATSGAPSVLPRRPLPFSRQSKSIVPPASGSPPSSVAEVPLNAAKLSEPPVTVPPSIPVERALPPPPLSAPASQEAQAEPEQPPPPPRSQPIWAATREPIATRAVGRFDPWLFLGSDRPTRLKLMAELATRPPVRRYGGPTGRIDRAFRAILSAAQIVGLARGRDRRGLINAIADSLELDFDLVVACLDDATGEPLAVLLKSLGLDNIQAQQVFLLAAPKIGRDVNLFFKICDLYAGMEPAVADTLSEAWRESRVSKGPRHVPHLAGNSDRPRPGPGEAVRPAAPTPAERKTFGTGGSG